MNYKRMVPNSISGLSQMLGLISIYLSMEKDFNLAAIFIILAARALGVSGPFGVEMDSLCDVCSFGMAPAVLIYTYSLQQLGVAGMVISGLFAFGAAMRLARFNVNVTAIHGYFQGMPAPAGACVIVTFVLGGMQISPLLTALLTVAVACLMYSDVKYPDFKGHGNPLFRVPVIIAFILGALVLWSDVKAWPFVIMFTYTLCGVLNAVYVKVTGKQAVFK